MRGFRGVTTLNRIGGVFAVVFVAIGLSLQLTALPVKAYSADAFVMEIDTTNASKSNTVFVIPTAPEATYDYTVDCDDTGPMVPVPSLTGNYTCEYDEPGVYKVVITGMFPQVQFGHYFDTPMNYQTNAVQLNDIKQWGNQQWQSMEGALSGAYNMRITASDAPDLRLVTSMAGMFASTTVKNTDLTSWDTSSVTDMSGLFVESMSFNADISTWDTSSVTNMAGMFLYSVAFGADISSWDVSSVVNMRSMFERTTSFKDQDLSGWDISGVQWFDVAPPLGTVNYDKVLGSWSQQDVQTGLNFVSENRYCAGKDARTRLIELHGWNIDGDAEDCNIPKITEVELHEGEGEAEGKKIMIIRGSNLLYGNPLLRYYFAYGGDIVRINGIQYKFCIENTPFSLSDLEMLKMYDSASAVSPCYYLVDEDNNSLVSDTEVRVWLPNDFDISKSGTVSFYHAPTFTFNQNSVPAPAQTSQSLAPVTLEATTVAPPLRTATLSVSDGEEYRGCANINTAHTHLFAPATATAPNGTTLLGGVGFELKCESPGGSAQVSLRLGQEYEDTSVLSAYKDLASDGALTPVDVTFVNRSGATYVEFPLTDGLTATSTGLIDVDGVEDGRIVDPLYIGVATSATAPEVAATDTVTFGAPNSGFGKIAAAVTSKVTAAMWIAIGVLFSITLLAVGMLLRRTRSA